MGLFLSSRVVVGNDRSFDQVLELLVTVLQRQGFALISHLVVIRETITFADACLRDRDLLDENLARSLFKEIHFRLAEVEDLFSACGLFIAKVRLSEDVVRLLRH